MIDFRRLLPIMAAAALLAAASRAIAADVNVISNAGVMMTREVVKAMFLGGVKSSGSLKPQPIDNAGTPADFLANVLKMTAAKYSATWTKKAFRDGLNAPPLKATDAEVLNFVEGNLDAISDVTSVPYGVHVIGES